MVKHIKPMRKQRNGTFSAYPRDNWTTCVFVYPSSNFQCQDFSTLRTTGKTQVPYNETNLNSSVFWATYTKVKLFSGCISKKWWKKLTFRNWAWALKHTSSSIVRQIWAEKSDFRFFVVLVWLITLTINLKNSRVGSLSMYDVDMFRETFLKVVISNICLQMTKIMFPQKYKKVLSGLRLFTYEMLTCISKFSFV